MRDKLKGKAFLSEWVYHGLISLLLLWMEFGKSPGSYHRFHEPWKWKRL